mgnify:FL=1|tara:strand:- start:889 stop:1119 length:231 start_codon:yes stop_codon:yes gene_type:complete
MSISKEDLLNRKEQIIKDYDTLRQEIEVAEQKIKQMRNNLNAIAGASQQIELFLKQLEDKNEMPADKKLALDMATS